MQYNYRGYPMNSCEMPEPYMVYGKGNGNGMQQESQGEKMIRDVEYFQSLYPDRLKKMQRYVMEACDRMDYKNGPIYDEYPDRVMINQTCGSICMKIREELGEWQDERVYFPEDVPASEYENSDVEEVEIYETAPCVQTLAWRGQQLENAPRASWGPPGPPKRPWGPPGPPSWGPPGPPSWGPPGPPSWGPPGPPPRPPRPIGPNWLDDTVKILLMNEMYRRRCHNGRC